MRNAERFLSQGKIRAAISEYRQVVEADPRDFGTLNILGDLYLKNAEKQEAVGCFTQVAEHYNDEGFSQKAIAIYNKIARLKPDSMEISAKLAQLYQLKGSYSEARIHYRSVAEDYQRKGLMIEALTIWKQIAELDPNDTEIYLKIAEIYWKEDQKEDAAKAFTEAGSRLSAQKQYESALATFSRALEINRLNLRALKGYVDTQIKLGCADEAAKILEEVLEQQPYARDVLLLLIDCYVDTNNPREAERTIVKLVEQEPANYPKFLDLVEIYLKEGDLNSATRILSMSSEHLLVGGQSEEFLRWTNEILARNPEHLDALRLAVRYHGWHRDESELKKSLEGLAETARLNSSVDDERYALTQLVMISPHETTYAQRLQEIKAEHGFDELEAEPLLGAETPSQDEPDLQDREIKAESVAGAQGEICENTFGNLNSSIDLSGTDQFIDLNSAASNGSNGSNGAAGEEFAEYIVEGVIDEAYSEKAEIIEKDDVELKASDQLRLEKEIESIEFYIAEGYGELAEKSLSALEGEFGNRKNIAELRGRLGEKVQTEPAPEVVAEIVETESFEAVPPDAKSADIMLDEFKSDLGFEDNENEQSGDYDTHYHMAIAYKEMGLMEEAAREFQDAINLASPADGTRRFFQCANLLGHCFIEKGMPNLAIVWYQRGLEVPDLNKEEKQALFYEIASAYQIGGDEEKALEYFEKIYAENVDYRDVSGRLEKLK